MQEDRRIDAGPRDSHAAAAETEADQTDQPGGAAGTEPVPRQTGKQLLDATRPFAVEVPLRSWWSVVSTLVLLAASLVLAAIVPWWPLRLIASLVGGLIFVRSFILYHDFMHGSLLRESRLAKPLFHTIGLFLLAPPRYWRYSHNFHHGNVGRPIAPTADGSLLVTSDLGSFPLMTTEAWQNASAWQRLRYRIMRHPLILLGAYFTVFLLGLTVSPFLQSPRKYWDGALSLLVHGALVVSLWFFGGFWMLWFAFLLPYGMAAAIGAYLFYAQHNYEGMRVLKPGEWTYYRGAIESSSYMRLSRLMDWFTGNIGYHHVHHLNPLIPFYRLPEAMAAVPELQQARETSLHLRDMVACLRLNLWDSEQQRLVGYTGATLAA